MLTINHDDEFQPRTAYRWYDGAFEAIELPRTDVLAAIKDTTILQAHNAWGPDFEAHTSQAIALLHPVDVPELANRISRTTLPKAS